MSKFLAYFVKGVNYEKVDLHPAKRCSHVHALCSRFATEPIQANQQAEIPDGFVLFDSETSFVDDGTGNLIEVTVNEYRRLIAPLARGRGRNEFILSTYLILLWELYLGSLVLL